MFWSQLLLLLAFTWWMPSQASMHSEPGNQQVPHPLMRSRSSSGKSSSRVSSNKESYNTYAKTQGLMRKSKTKNPHVDEIEINSDGKVSMRKPGSAPKSKSNATASGDMETRVKEVVGNAMHMGGNQTSAQSQTLNAGNAMHMGGNQTSAQSQTLNAGLDLSVPLPPAKYPPSVVKPTCGGTASGASCHFPFYVKGKKYSSCTDIDDAAPWCYTHPNETYWGYCECEPQLDENLDIVIDPPDGAADFAKATCGGDAMGAGCHFPFFYKGMRFDRCTSMNAKTPWCFTDASMSHFGYCKCDDDEDENMLTDEEAKNLGKAVKMLRNLRDSLRKDDKDEAMLYDKLGSFEKDLRYAQKQGDELERMVAALNQGNAKRKAKESMRKRYIKKQVTILNRLRALRGAMRKR